MIESLINENDFNNVNDENYFDHMQMKTILERRIIKLNSII